MRSGGAPGRVRGVHRLLIPVLLAVPLLAAGCGETVIDAGKAEAFVEKTAKGAGAKVEAVSCPGGMKAVKGERFTCTISGTDGSKDKLVMQESDDEGTARTTSAFIRPAAGERLVTRAVREQVTKEPVTATCPEVVVATAGRTWTCLVRGEDGTEGEVQVRSKDRTGAVSVDADFLHVRDAERVIAGKVRKRTGAKGVEVSCPDIQSSTAGSSFDCEVEAADGSATIVVTLTDDQGSFTYEPKD